MRISINGMLWLNRSGTQWRQLPKCYGPWQSVYSRFAKWVKDGVWETIFSELIKDTDTENLSMDSTCVKVHESSNGGKKAENTAIGRTKGGLNTKIHAIVDGLWVDYYLYKERHLVECFFQKMKWFRRIATRYDKLDRSFLAFVYMADIMIWLL